MRRRFLLLVLFLLPAGRASAEWQIKPWLGTTFAAGTTFVEDLDQGASVHHIAVGITGVRLGEVLGIEADVAHVPRFFQSGGQFSQLILGSSVTTATGNVIVAAPRRWTEYTLRPYFVAGGGLMRARIDDYQDILSVSSNLAAWDMGVGVTGFLSDHFGVSWDVRRFRSVGGQDPGSVGDGPRLSFWRANMALAIRY